MHLIPVISYYFLPFVNANSEIIGNLYSLPTPGSHSGSFAGPFADSGWWLGSSYKTLLLLTEAMNTQILCLVKDTSRSVIILTICGLWYIYGNVVVHRFFVFCFQCFFLTVIHSICSAASECGCAHKDIITQRWKFWTCQRRSFCSGDSRRVPMVPMVPGPSPRPGDLFLGPTGSRSGFHSTCFNGRA